MEIVDFLGGLLSRDLVISAVLFVCLWRVWVKLCAILDSVIGVISQNAAALNGLKDEIEKCPKRGRNPAGPIRITPTTGTGEPPSHFYLARASNAASDLEGVE